MDAVAQATENPTDSARPVRFQPKPRKGGAALPVGKGRVKGQPNRVTTNLRHAIELACKPGACHEDGLTGWLIERARGGVQDRQIFAAVVTKVLPAHIHTTGTANGVTINLAWLAGRAVAGGTLTTQADRNTLIIQADTRSNDPGSDAQPASQSASEAENPRADDPHPPVEPAHPPG